MESLLRLSRLIDAVNERVGRSIYWLVLIAVLISAGNAVVRKTFNWSSNALLEIQWYLFATVFLLGAGYTLFKNEHVRIDVISGHLSHKAQLWIDLIGTVFFLTPLCLLILYYGWPYFMNSFISQEWSSNPGGLIIWPVKIMIPAGFFLLLLQALSQLIKIIGGLSGHVDPATLIKSHGHGSADVEVEEFRAMLSDRPTPNNDNK
ncbi:MAG TPA: TRAP transporter small permease subunit [Candidatus Competibacteraceae bacterium]|nr:TRAP transporter small permease subunit [Candidatus Competibacteraceae bacterium]